MPRVVNEQERQRRLEIYKLGLTDEESAKLVGCTVGGYRCWRKREGLPIAARLLDASVSYKKVLPQEKWPMVECFLRDFARDRPKNVAEYLKAWVKCDCDRERGVTANLPGGIVVTIPGNEVIFPFERRKKNYVEASEVKTYRLSPEEIKNKYNKEARVNGTTNEPSNRV